MLDIFLFIYLQKKLEKELEDIDDKHETKKRKFLESSEEFHKKLKKVHMMNTVRALILLLARINIAYRNLCIKQFVTGSAA